MNDKHLCSTYTTVCLVHLARFLQRLGCLTPPNAEDSSREPLSLHSPLMRHAACFIQLSVFEYGANLYRLLAANEMLNSVRHSRRSYYNTFQVNK
ncbi:unnamed protein product [Protopolystoma xenopodis]|uniref:Uncharacterized protein n=1 Tax=Protopolystoma xenopodis TaxID=117903 RepID=A0A3S5CKJ9_9PLAT|nr:unnamed protein product [Protopolystoma xenopodis]